MFIFCPSSFCLFSHDTLLIVSASLEGDIESVKSITWQLRSDRRGHINVSAVSRLLRARD